MLLLLQDLVSEAVKECRRSKAETGRHFLLCQPQTYRGGENTRRLGQECEKYFCKFCFLSLSNNKLNL